MVNLNPRSILPGAIHSHIYFVLLCLLVMAMPTSYYVMSLSQILLGVNWLFEGKYKEKTLRFVKNRPAVVFTFIYLIHIVGLIWSEDMEYGVTSDLKDKLPMLTLTFLIASSKPLQIKKLYIILYLFFGAVLVGSFVGFSVYLSGDYINFRKISPFISHIYFSMMICMTIITLPWITHKITNKKSWIFLAFTASAWLIGFLFILNSLTGLLCLLGIAIFFVIRLITSPQVKSWIRIAIAFVSILFVTATLFTTQYIYEKISKVIEPEKQALEEKTLQGNEYMHFFDIEKRENGHYVYYFISEDEIREAWSRRSDLDFYGNDLNFNELRITLYRYLSSKGLRKDLVGMNQLSDGDIEEIERGIPNYMYTQWPGFLVRLHVTIWEVYWYRATDNPTNFSFAQRIELWKGSWIAFKEKPLIGWGTGDIFIAVRFGLETMESQMENYHMKPHNQFLIFLLTLGIFGSLAIYLCYFIFIRISGAYKYLPFNIFLIIMFVTMIGAHPIDAQAGQSFFTFFTLYFGILYHQKIEENNPHL